MGEYIQDQFDVMVFDKDGNVISRDTTEPLRIEGGSIDNFKFKRELTVLKNEDNKNLYEGAKNHNGKIVDLHLNEHYSGKFKITFNDKEELVLLEQ